MMRYKLPLLLLLIFYFSHVQSFEHFTGKVVRDKVRLRLFPDLESAILRELHLDDLVIVVGEVEGFYAVAPPNDIKAFVFRTFVLDNVVEGTRVNVRLEPDLDAPIIAQLNSGDEVQGHICPTHKKWLEIAPPEDVSFYVYKDYIDNVGDANYLFLHEERHKAVNQRLNTAYEMSQKEMQKTFDQIDIDPITVIIHEITEQYTDFPEYIQRATSLLTLIQECYLQQKADYLEFKTHEDAQVWQQKNQQLLSDMEVQKKRLSELEQQLQQLSSASPAEPIATDEALSKEEAMSLPASATDWLVIEQQLFEQRQPQDQSLTLIDYYQQQASEAHTLTGLLKPYNRHVKNKPGDYLLVNPLTQMPIAFLYSTTIDLIPQLGQQVTVLVSPRPDNHFAFPAYFVHKVK